METGQPSILMEILSQRAIASMVMLIGMVVAIAKMRQYPGPSRLMLLGAGLLLFPTIGSSMGYYFVLERIAESDTHSLTQLRTAVHFATVLTRTTGMLLLFAAVYYQRGDFRQRSTRAA